MTSIQNIDNNYNYNYDSANYVLITKYFKQNKTDNKSFLEYVTFIDKYNKLMNKLIIEQNKENSKDINTLLKNKNKIHFLNTIYKKTIRNKNKIHQSNNQMKMKIEETINYKEANNHNPIWFFGSFHYLFTKSSDILYSKLFNVYTTYDIKSKKSSQRKDILNKLNYRHQTKKKYKLEKEKLNLEAFKLKIEFLSLKKLIISNRKLMYQKYYSDSKDINYHLNYNRTTFLDSQENIDLIYSLIKLHKNIALYKNKIKLLEQKEEELANPPIDKNLKKYLRNNHNHNHNHNHNLKYSPNKILVINKTKYMYFIALLNNKIIKQISNYQNSIQNEIQELNCSNKNLEDKIQKYQKDGKNDKIIETKLSIFYKKNINKLEKMLIKILQE